MKSTSNKTLNYWHYAESGGFSLDPRDSDSYVNFVLLYQIVGTLVKNGADGTYEGFLADSWKISPDKHTYTFYFKPNLNTSRGKIVNALEYSKVFHFLSKYLSKGGGGGLVQFDRIVGMNDYLSGKSEKIYGVNVEKKENSISFTFLEPPDDLLIAFTEPYFGFYNLEDFDSDIRLKNAKSLDCSGLFDISTISDDRRSVVIKRRTNFSLSSLGVSHYHSIHLRLFSGFEFEKDHSDSIVYGFKDTKDSWNEEFIYTTSDPNMLGALVLSPLLEPFRNLDLRLEVSNQIDKIYKELPLDSPRSQPTNYFNFLSTPSSSFKLAIHKNDSPQEFSGEKLSIDVAYFNLLTSERNWINDILERASDNLPVVLKLKQIDRTQPGEFAAVNSDLKYASRFVTVVVGGTASNQNNKMMFCSDLGVSFKDPSKRMCDLINRYERKSGFIDQAYIDEFNKVLWEDAVVIPMMHLGFMWLHDKNVNADALRSGLGMPRLDLVKRK